MATAEGARATRRSSGIGSRALARVERGLWWLGCTLLGVAAAMAADAYWYQHRAAGELRAAARGAATVGIPSSPPALPAAGTPLARLTIPRLSTSVVVAEGVTDTVLRRAVGRVPASARFDESGNVTLAGHRDTFFRPLERIRAGDRIVIERGGGRSEYSVEWAAVVQPDRVEVTHDPGYPALTLVTCYPFEYVGDAPYRFVVRARRIDPPPASRRSS